MANTRSPLRFATRRQIANCRIIATELRDWKRKVEENPGRYLSDTPFVESYFSPQDFFYPYMLRLRTLKNLYRSSPKGDEIREFVRLKNMRVEQPEAYQALMLRREVETLRAEVAELKSANGTAA